ncbi:MAG: enoyl-CoA hydratase-related protein [Chloroflexota bacterium]
MPFETIAVSKQDHVATVTLSRPERLNAMNRQMFSELTAALEELDADEDVRVVVLTGAGRAFCAGDDISVKGSEKTSLVETRPEAMRLSIRQSQKLIKKLQSLTKPTIAMVNGPAVGGGFDLALACDLRMGSDKARFRVAFTRLGLVPGTGGPWLLPRVVGLPKAAELLFTGDFLEAREAERIGVLSRLVPAEQLQQETMELAKRIAGNPPIALRLDKMFLYKCLEVDLDTALDMISAAEPNCIASEDHREGIAAFRQKREPVFRGK